MQAEHILCTGQADAISLAGKCYVPHTGRYGRRGNWGGRDKVAEAARAGQALALVPLCLESDDAVTVCYLH